MTAEMVPIGLNDKNHQELFVGDTVQIVNGVNAGKNLYKIRSAGKPYLIEGNLSPNADDPNVLQISNKKVMRLTP